MELPGLGASVTKLVDSVEVIEDETGEYLAIELSPDAGAPCRSLRRLRAPEP